MKAIVAALLLVTLFGCNYNNLKDEGKGGGGGFDESKLQAPDFMTVQMALIGPKCLSCHSNAGGNKGESNLENYKNVRSQLDKLVYRVLEAKNMPPKEKLSDRELQLFRNWIDLGAPEKQIADGEKPDPGLEQGPNNFAKVRDKIFAKKCAACHFPPDSPDGPPPEKGLDLSSGTMVREKATVIFNRIFITKDMPMAPYPAITPRERRVLLKWFELGMPD